MISTFREVIGHKADLPAYQQLGHVAMSLHADATPVDDENDDAQICDFMCLRVLPKWH